MSKEDIDALRACMAYTSKCWAERDDGKAMSKEDIDAVRAYMAYMSNPQMLGEVGVQSRGDLGDGRGGRQVWQLNVQTAQCIIGYLAT